MSTVRATPLGEWHRDHGGKMVDFAGWSMPLNYGSGAVAEHDLVRQSAGLFDVSHMGRLLVSGTGALGWLSGLVSSDLAQLAPGASTYGLLLNDMGGVIDDVFVYRREQDWLVVVNASNRETDVSWLEAHPWTGGGNVELRDVSDQSVMYALQGPRAMEIADGFLEGTRKSSELVRFGSGVFKAGEREVFTGRTGYTGEDGVEIFLGLDSDGALPEHGVALWEALLARAAKDGIPCHPVGLAARDSLRFEAGMPLHGHEIGPGRNPVDSRLAWACHLDKTFVGRDAVAARKSEGSREVLVTLTCRGGVPREGCVVLDANGNEIGACVSGMFCPTVKVFAANAFVPSRFAELGIGLQISVRGKMLPAVVVRRPLVLPSWKRSHP